MIPPLYRWAAIALAVALGALALAAWDSARLKRADAAGYKRAQAEYTAAAHLQSGRVYPPVRELREVSIRVGVRVIEQALKEGVAGNTDLAGCDLDAYLRSRFWKPRYLPIVRGDHTAMIDHPGYPKDE